jgi:hypothetical protein
MAINLVAAHDLVAAELELQFDKGSADDAAFTAALHVAQALWALESGEPSRAASEIEAFSAMLAAHGQSGFGSDGLLDRADRGGGGSP